MKPIEKAVLAKERGNFLAALLQGELTCDAEGVPSVADRGSAISVGISRAWVDKLGASVKREKASGQSAGKQFEHAVADFIESTFLTMENLRPGNWRVFRGSDRHSVDISNLVLQEFR